MNRRGFLAKLTAVVAGAVVADRLLAEPKAEAFDLCRRPFGWTVDDPFMRGVQWVGWAPTLGKWIAFGQGEYMESPDRLHWYPARHITQDDELLLAYGQFRPFR